MIQKAIELSTLLLALAFGSAGLAKILVGSEVTRFCRALGMNGRLARLTASLLPPTELAAAFGLLHPITRPAATLVVWLLSLSFVGVTAYAFAMGDQPFRSIPHCSCFGRSRPISFGVAGVIRAYALCALASFVVWTGPVNAGRIPGQRGGVKAGHC
ncbi:MauE/DoxX family redox-associated membrane protein [Sphingomonas sp. PWP1-2]|uniref:MauE/DoxX family redox-associated membrane protein n=1 Tax=Sphingomonas sp. PWP1-2 TaxID=2804558 RepID=UPI003CED8DBD